MKILIHAVLFIFLSMAAHASNPFQDVIDKIDKRKETEEETSDSSFQEYINPCSNIFREHWDADIPDKADIELDIPGTHVVRPQDGIVIDLVVEDLDYSVESFPMGPIPEMEYVSVYALIVKEDETTGLATRSALGDIAYLNYNDMGCLSPYASYRLKGDRWRCQAFKDVKIEAGWTLFAGIAPYGDLSRLKYVEIKVVAKQE